MKSASSARKKVSTSATDSDTVAPASDPEIFGTHRSNRDAERGDVKSSDGSAARDDGGCSGGTA